MPGYSGTPLAQKLGIKDGAAVLLAGAPEGFERELQGLPTSATLSRSPGRATYDVIVAFASSSRELADHLQRLVPRLNQTGGLWLAWPKKSSGVPTDVTESVIRESGLATGLVDNKVCAVTDVWSGLRFVVRVKDRAPKAASKPARNAKIPRRSAETPRRARPKR